MKNKFLVAYFSVTGSTARLANSIAEAVGADIFEILPQVPYSVDDLNWRNENSRSAIEMKDPNNRPPILGNVENMEEYDTIFIGFPIWWQLPPHVIHTFLEGYNLTGKIIIPFATSSGSGIGDSASELEKSALGAQILSGRRFDALEGTVSVTSWIAALGI